MFIGLGTFTNVVTVLVGGLIGLVLGGRLSKRTRGTITDVLGLATLVIGGLSVVSVTSVPLHAAAGQFAFLIVLGALLLGTLTGSTLGVEARLDQVGDGLRRLLTRGAGDRERFVTGFVTATMVFCVGPLTILGSLSDGLGRGAEQLLVKSVLDGFAAVAFASTLGIGVLASAISVAVIQGALTLVGFWLGDVLPAAQIDALTATGGVLLLGLGLRLLEVRLVRVGDMLPALVFAPLLVTLVDVLR